MSASPAQLMAREEMTGECLRLVAATALEASESMPTSRRIMIHQGIAAIFPEGSPECQEAMDAAQALRIAESKQLSLFQRLTQSPT